MSVILASLALASMLSAIAVVDLKTHRIPDRLSLPLIAIGLAYAFWSSDRPWLAHVIGAIAGYASLAGFGALYYRLRGREGLGLGDAKLFAAAGAWLGWQHLPFVLLVASLGGLLYAGVARRAHAHSPLALGPWLALGLWIGWLLTIRYR